MINARGTEHNLPDLQIDDLTSDDEIETPIAAAKIANIALPSNKSWASIVMRDQSDGTKTSEKPSPIQLATMDKSEYAKIINGLFQQLGDTGYRWHQIKTFSLPRILVENFDTKGKIITWLSAHNYEFNTFADRGPKRKSFLLQGLAHGGDDDNIKSISTALAAVGINGEPVSSHFLTGHMKRNPSANDTPIYQITLKHNFDDSNLSKIAP